MLRSQSTPFLKKLATANTISNLSCIFLIHQNVPQTMSFHLRYIISRITWTRRGGRWSKKSLFLSTFRFKNVHVHSFFGSCGFQWCGFHLCVFSKMLSLLYKLRNTVLNTNDLSGADLVHAYFFQT